MYVATILPVKYLKLDKEDNFHMSLAQFIGEDCDESREYTKFYQKQVKRGAFVLMDNGAAEGAQPTAEELVPKIKLLNPTETILPDTIYDKEVTVAKAEHAIEVYRRAGITCKLMGVPQGRTFDQWKDCCMQLLDLNVSTIGISKFITPMYVGENDVALEYVRFRAAHFVRQCTSLVDIHLLGCWDDAKEVGEIAKSAVNVRSADSAIAYIYTKANMVMNGVGKRPKAEIDFYTKEEVNDKLLEINKRRWELYSNAVLC